MVHLVTHITFSCSSAYPPQKKNIASGKHHNPTFSKKREYTMPRLIITLISILVFNTCNNPVSTDTLQPGRRDYTWKVDTLYLPFNPFTDITGTSPNDVWVCSPGDADKIFYHFDGKTWKTDLVFRIFSPLSIYTNYHDVVWSAGLEGRIWQNLNGAWKEKLKFTLDSATNVDLISIYSDSQTNIITVGQYFVGQNYWGIILKYDGKTWKQADIIPIRTAFANIEFSDNNKFYLWGVTNEPLIESSYQFYELDDKNLKEIYSGSQNTNADYGGLLQLGSKTYFITGYDFFSYNGNSFIKIGRLSDDPKFLNAGVGRNEKDIFLGMRDGIAHYNGENTIYLYQTSGNVFVRKGILFEKDVFFLGRDANGNNLIFHGTLAE